MTQEELDAAIADLIVAQDKPKNTGNSHKRKQWENRRNWQLCTIGRTCKTGYAKICPLAKQKPATRNVYKSWLCWECCVDLHSYWRMSGVFYSCDSDTHYKRFSYNCKGLRVAFNRLFRRTFKGDIGNFGYYRKIFDYAWECI